MSEINNVSCPMTEYYPDIYNWNGVMMDAASYAKHQRHSESAPEPDTSPAKESADALDDIFDVPQDLRQIAAAIQEDTIKESCDTICAWQTQTHQLLLEAPKYLRVGSGSYRSSGSFVVSSYLSSYLSSYTTSYRSSGSFRLPSSGSLSSLSALGGYGLDLI